MQNNLAKYHFSQSMLEDWLACRQRFYLRHIAFMEWPELETDQYVEQRRRTQKGMEFHHMIEKFVTDVPAEDISRMEMSPDVRQWWDNFVTVSPLNMKDALFFPEITMSGVIDSYLFVAKCDVIAVLPDGCIQIWDWKTAAKMPKLDRLGKHIQTRLYRLIATMAGESLNDGKTLSPEQVEMIYWFPNFPNSPMHFPYTAKAMEQDTRYFSQVAAEITALGSQENFPKSADLSGCKFCQFRSYCDRGEIGGSLEDYDDIGNEMPGMTTLDLETVPEIEL